MFVRALTFPLAHWRGQIGLLPTLLFTLLGMRLAIAWAGGIRFPVLDLALYGWQVVGSWRALTRSQKDRPDFLVMVAGYAAILATVPVLVLPQLDRLSRSHLTPLAPMAPRPDGVAVMTDHILLAGPLSFDMFEGFRAAMAAHPDLTRVVLDSHGGRVYAARAMAGLIRDRGMHTQVRDICASACTLLFIAGARRSLAPGGRLGFHGYATKSRFRLTDKAEEEARDRATFLAHGVSADFVERMFQVPHDDMWFPERAQLEEAGILPLP